MTLKEEVQALLKSRGIKPVKYRGQNFLVDQQALRDIVSTASIKPGDRILEVGAGVGNLTRMILEAEVKVIAVEKDEALAEILKKTMGYNKNLKILNQDILTLDESVLASPYSIIGNIPYYITGPIVRKFLLSANSPAKMVLTVQKEVGERMVAKPPKSTFLSMMLSVLAEVEKKKIIRAESFWPKPKVDSVVALITPKKSADKAEELIELIRAGFRQPRKTLVNNLVAAGRGEREKIINILQELELSEKTRAHELALGDWKRLSEKLLI